MNSGTFIYNGRSSDDFGIFLTEEPTFITPERQATILQVPGRSGDIVVMEEAWKNYDQELKIGFGAKQGYNVQDEFYEISRWLNSANGYARLELSNEPDVFRMAYTVNGAEVTNHLNRIGEATLTFNCRPERWLKSGEDKGSSTNVKTVCGSNNPYVYAYVGTPGPLRNSIFNPTPFNAKPLMAIIAPNSDFVHGGTITMTAESGNVYTITISDDFENAEDKGRLMLDCETGNSYGTADSTYSYNQYVTFGNGIPVLEPGVTVFSTTGFNSENVIDIRYVPRWFVI